MNILTKIYLMCCVALCIAVIIFLLSQFWLVALFAGVIVSLGVGGVSILERVDCGKWP